MQYRKAHRNGTIILPYNWRDQYVNALGVYYEMTDKFNIHDGYNYGNNPAPKSTMDPTSANIPSTTWSAGSPTNSRRRSSWTRWRHM